MFNIYNRYRFKVKNVYYKQNIYLKSQSDQVNEAKFHRCALDWCDQCAFCDMGYDVLKSMDANSEEYSKLLIEKINESVSKLEGI